MQENNSGIDFVVIWVDGNDPQWRQEKNRFSPDEAKFNINDVRYRDWDILHYWFRAVEKYAPWVRKVHFVTCGHVPQWLNLEHPKLHFVKHSDYIDAEFLPTFSANPIELNPVKATNINALATGEPPFFILDSIMEMTSTAFS